MGRSPARFSTWQPPSGIAFACSESHCRTRYGLHRRIRRPSLVSNGCSASLPPDIAPTSWLSTRTTSRFLRRGLPEVTIIHSSRAARWAVPDNLPPVRCNVAVSGEPGIPKRELHGSVLPLDHVLYRKKHSFKELSVSSRS